MNALWTYFWPALGVGVAVGVITGAIAFRRRARQEVRLVIGAVAAVILAALWHGPLGGANQFQTRVDRGIRATLSYYEMTQVNAHLHHDPLTRRVLLSGPADDFQRGELVRLMEELPGVSSASWSPDGGGVPLIAEGAGVSITGFLLGLLLAYLVELRRRYNAEWDW
jgi:hypothetical protein